MWSCMAHWTSGSLIILLKLCSYVDAHTLGRVSPTQSSNSSRQVSRHSAEQLSVYLNCLHWPLDTGFLAFSLSISIFSIPSLVCLVFGFRFNWSVNSFVHIYMVCVVVNADMVQCKRWQVDSHPLSLFMGYFLELILLPISHTIIYILELIIKTCKYTPPLTCPLP